MPEGQLQLAYELGADHVAFEIDETTYPLDAIYAAAYLFLGRGYAYLSRPREATVSVRLTSRQPATAAELDALATDFAAALAGETLRARLAQSTMRIREYYTAAALRTAASAPSVEDLLAELESEELLEDPLEIMVPWEGQQGGEPKKDPEPDKGNG